MRPEVIVHHLAQAKAVLLVVQDRDIDIQLRSAPGAAAYVGVGYLQALGAAVGHELLIDCGDDAGLVMAALRTDCRKLIFSGEGETWRRLGSLAGRHGAALRGPMDPTPPCLSLSPDDDDYALLSWLERQVRDEKRGSAGRSYQA